MLIPKLSDYVHSMPRPSTPLEGCKLYREYLRLYEVMWDERGSTDYSREPEFQEYENAMYCLVEYAIDNRVPYTAVMS